MNSAVIVDAVRSPLAKGRAADGDRLGGALSGLHPVELLSQVFSRLFARNGIDPATVDDVITGCVSQVGEQSGLIGRWSWLAAGLPENVPSTTINRACGSEHPASKFPAQAGTPGGVHPRFLRRR